MTDHVIDTNVLLVASAADPHSPFSGSDLPPDLQAQVFEWLVSFRQDPAQVLVLDDWFRIYDEYRNKLTEQDYGLQVVSEKMNHARLVPVAYDTDGAALVPPNFSSLDPSDRKLLAALIAAPAGSCLVNATDTDWLAIERALDQEGLRVLHLLDAWLRSKHAAKQRR